MRFALVTFFATVLSPVAGAQAVALPSTDARPILIAAADQPMSEGEVRKVDPSAKKITIKHGELVNLGMPPMTMVFQLKDPALLDKVKAGDKVKFRADKVNGAFTIMEIEAVK
ncbi:MAG: copper-binding protein [Casimicrobiaceae bacterium]